MESKKKELPGLNDYSQSLSETVAKNVGADGKLTTIVCMTCEENFTPHFDDVEAINECKNIRIWRFAYPSGGDIFIFMSCYKCSKKDPKRITNLDKVVQMATVMTERLSMSPEPAMNPHLYWKVISIWGIDAKEVIALRDECGL